MPTYLVNWNPDRWQWHDAADYVAKSRAGESPVLKWSTGNRQNIEAGDRIFLVRQGTDRGIIGSGIAVGPSYRGPHWDSTRTDETNHVDIRWDAILDPSNVLAVSELERAELGVPWQHLFGSGVQVPDESTARLENLWAEHLKRIGLPRNGFVVGNSYSRHDVYEILRIPDDRRRGNWETGYNQWGNDLYIFCNVGAAGRSGHDYDNRWLDDSRFQWFAKERTNLKQKQIQWMLGPTGSILLFTRKDNREPFVFQGYAEADEYEDTSPVKIIWRIHKYATTQPPANLALARRAELENRNYIRKADPTAFYWFDFSKNRIQEYRERCGEDFAIILAGDENSEADYYRIPYPAIAHMLVDAHIVGGQSGRERWNGDVRQHRMRISHCPTKLDIAEYYGVPLFESTELPESVENDYAIENRLAEVRQRVKQSVFRQRVLENFGSRCCVSAIAETDLLVASHIVPWSVKIESRLDPANGLCLFVLFDALFDAGYFTIADDLCVQTADDDGFSDVLRETLKGIAGRRIASPRLPLNVEYLKYHREHVFRG